MQIERDMRYVADTILNSNLATSTSITSTSSSTSASEYSLPSELNFSDLFHIATTTTTKTTSSKIYISRDVLLMMSFVSVLI